MDVLSIQGLTKQYPTFLLDQVSFTVRQGEIMGFIGRNGAGKTTTLKALLHYVHPDAGQITFFGLPYSAHELAIKQRIGFVSGGVDYFPHKTLRTITAVTRSFYHTWDDVAYRRYLAAFALDDRKTPSQLSAGMKVKFNLALALSHRAELLLLDEPTSGLDPVSRDELLDILNTLSKEGTSILFSTHITSDLDRCADRITYIRNGRILASESLSDFVAGYRTVRLPESDLPPTVRGLLIGLKPAKEGFSALVKATDAALLGRETQPADLDQIMIHLEKE